MFVVDVSAGLKWSYLPYLYLCLHLYLLLMFNLYLLSMCLQGLKWSYLLQWRNPCCTGSRHTHTCAHSKKGENTSKSFSIGRGNKNMPHVKTRSAQKLQCLQDGHFFCLSPKYFWHIIFLICLLLLLILLIINCCVPWCLLSYQHSAPPLALSSTIGKSDPLVDWILKAGYYCYCYCQAR